MIVVLGRLKFQTIVSAPDMPGRVFALSLSVATGLGLLDFCLPPVRNFESRVTT